MNEDMLGNEARRPAPNPPGIAMQAECAKQEIGRGVSYIDHQPDNQVVLSKRLEYLIRRVGGCQTEEVMALVRGIMYEVLSQRKF